MVETVRKNKSQLLLEFINLKERPVCRSLFGFGADPNPTLLLSYVFKKKKNAILLSTLHSNDEYDHKTGDALKPEAISFYSLTKGAEDVVGRMKKEYLVKTVSNRWPMTSFNGLLNLTTVNVYI